MQSTGAFKAAARLASATPPPPFVLSRGIGWQVSYQETLRYYTSCWWLLYKIIVYFLCPLTYEKSGNRAAIRWPIWYCQRLYCLCVSVSVYLFVTKHVCIQILVQFRAMPDIMYITLPNRENVGLLGSTRIGSRRVIQISAGFMIFFSILGEMLLSVQSIKRHWTSLSLVLNSFYGFREIRRAVRLNSIHGVCCYILCIVWLRRYAKYLCYPFHSSLRVVCLCYWVCYFTSPVLCFQVLWGSPLCSSPTWTRCAISSSSVSHSSWVYLYQSTSLGIPQVLNKAQRTQKLDGFVFFSMYFKIQIPT